MRRGTGLRVRPRTLLLALAVAAGLAALIVYSRLAHLGLGREAATGAATSSGGGFHHGDDRSADDGLVVGHKKPQGRPRGKHGGGGSGVGRPNPNTPVHVRRRFPPPPPPPARSSAAGNGGVDGDAEQRGVA